MKKFRLNEELNSKVKIRLHKGFESEGNLYLSKGKAPYLRLTNLASAESHIKSLICMDDNQTYTLYNVESYGSLLYPSLVVFGDYPFTDANEFTITLSGISEWLKIKDGFQVSSSEISKKIDFENIEITISESLKACIDYNCAIIKNKNLQTTIDEDLLITLSSTHQIDLADINELCHRFCNLFSLLLGHPIEINSIWIRRNNSSYPVYIVAPTAMENAISSNRECLYPFPNFISERNLWPTIFQTAFVPGTVEHERFTNLWSRIPSLVRYSTLWEYLTLGYVSILDKYTESFAKKQSKRLPRKEFKKLKDHLKYSLNQKAQELKIENNPIVEIIDKYIDHIKNTETPTFNLRIKTFTESLDQRIIEIIGLTESDFRTLKTIRDQIAHGNPVQTFKGHDITHEMTLTSKLSLLIHYCISMDFGLTADEFIQSLGATTHPDTRGARINRDKIYKFSESVLKINLSKDDYQILAKSRYPFIIFTSTDNRYCLDKTASEKTRQFGSDNSENHICDFLSKRLNINRSKIQYHSTIHITSDENERAIHGCCTISDSG